jgi:hypothetical protein
MTSCTEEVEAALTAFVARERRSRQTVRVLGFQRGLLSRADARRIPEDARVEIDEDGCAFLSVAGQRLLYAGDLARLLCTLGLRASCLRLEHAE